LRGKLPEGEPPREDEAAGEGRASRRRNRRQRARERRRELATQGTEPEGASPNGEAPAASNGPIDLAEIDPELARQIAALPPASRRRNRQRRDPAEILARLKQQIGIEDERTRAEGDQLEATANPSAAGAPTPTTETPAAAEKTTRSRRGPSRKPEIAAE